MKERLVICNEGDTDGRATVTRDEERVLHVCICANDAIAVIVNPVTEG